jgi:hypothetical protein
VSIETQNLSGTFEPAQGTLKLYKINPPALVSNAAASGTHPDQVTMTKAEHDSLFPDDYYANEDQLTSENVGTLPQVFRFDNRTKPETIPIPFASLETGDYLVAVETQDRFGKPLKLEKRFTLYSSLSTELATRVPSFFAIPDERSYEPGDTFRFVWGSAYPDVEAYYELEHRGRIIKQERLNARVLAAGLSHSNCGRLPRQSHMSHLLCASLSLLPRRIHHRSALEQQDPQSRMDVVSLENSARRSRRMAT